MSCRPLDVESFRNRARLPKGITRRKRGGYDESKKVSRTLLTAPFLLLSHHYLHRAAPETYGRLCHLPGVGWMIRKADKAEHSWKDRRALWKSLAWSALSAAVFLVVHPPLPVALAIEFGLATFSGSNA